MAYSRSAPSQRYQDLLGMYQQMHQEGDVAHQTPPEQTFSGISLPPHLLHIKRMIQKYQVKTLIDYGCDKAMVHQMRPFEMKGHGVFQSLQHFWGLDAVTLYDPAHAPFSAFPEAPADMLICTDVLEHCSEDDMDWILAEMFSLATKALYTNIACYPARKTLPNGENAHCTLKEPAWWQAKLKAASAQFPAVRWAAVLTYIKAQGGQMVKENLVMQG